MSTPEVRTTSPQQNILVLRFDHNLSQIQEQWWQRRLARLDSRQQAAGTKGRRPP